MTPQPKQEQAPLTQRDKAILSLVGVSSGAALLVGVALFNAVRQRSQ